MPSKTEVFVLPAFTDNYFFVIRDHHLGKTAVVDPGDAGVITRFLDEKKWALDQIWCSHHHLDHSGGIAELKSKYSARVFGFEKSRLSQLFDVRLKDQDRFHFGEAEVYVLETPGHTLDHIIFYVASIDSAFVGDTIFAMGCGRLFEGTAKQMFLSLKKITSFLNPDTKIFCAHEYTLANAKFSMQVDHNNQALIRRLKDVENLRQANQATVPFTLQEELETNPFIRAPDSARFAEIRRLKDKW